MEELNRPDLRHHMPPPPDKPTTIPQTLPVIAPGEHQAVIRQYNKDFLEHALQILVLQAYIEAFHPERNQQNTHKEIRTWHSTLQK